MKKKAQFFLQNEIFEEVSNLFQKEKTFWGERLPFADFQHVGSSAISGAVTKKDLDIQIRVRQEHFWKTIMLLRYYLCGSSHRETLKKMWTNQFAILTSWREQVPIDYLITVIDSSFDEHWKIRDFLTQNPKVLEAYNDLKWSYNGCDYDLYSKAKREFLGEKGNQIKHLTEKFNL
jgi:GrpB-like predicted nucleotidyltransferase (UPF0157 family)